MKVDFVSSTIFRNYFDRLIQLYWPDVLTKTRFEISKNLNDQAIDETKRILITEVGKDNSVMGRADNYQPIVVKQELELGTFEKVKIVDATDSYLIGEIQ